MNAKGNSHPWWRLYGAIVCIITSWCCFTIPPGVNGHSFEWAILDVGSILGAVVLTLSVIHDGIVEVKQRLEVRRIRAAFDRRLFELGFDPALPEFLSVRPPNSPS